MLQIQPCAERPDDSPARQKFSEKPIVGLTWPHSFCLYLTAYFVRQDGVMACVQFPSPSYKIHHIPTVRMSRKRKKNRLWHEKEWHKCFILVLKLTLTRCFACNWNQSRRRKKSQGSVCSCLRLRPSPTAAREYVSVRQLYYGSLRNLSLKLGHVMVQCCRRSPSFIYN